LDYSTIRDGINLDIPSNWGFDPNNSNNDIQLQVSNGRITTIAVK